MSSPKKIEADIVIFGGGFMGLALAEVAISRGQQVVIIERPGISPPHYMSGLIAPRADYLRLDKEEVELTAFECNRWLKLFPDIIKPKLYIMPFSDSSPYSYSFLKPLMEYYDRLTAIRLGGNFKPSFRINNAILEQTEPNLRKKYFTDALGFYELTVESDVLLQNFRGKLSFRNPGILKIADQIGYNIHGNRIEEVKLFFNGYITYLIENKRGLTIVNVAGPWMQDMAGQLGITLPIKYSLGFQGMFSNKYIFQHSLITFGPDGKYSIISQKKDYIQLGPTNTLANGPEDINNPIFREKATKYLSGVLENVVEKGLKLKKAEIKSGGLRVKLKFPFIPDSNRPFILNPIFENYYVVYPGKTVLALKTAEELMNKIVDNKKLVFCLNGDRKIRSSLRLNIVRIKSLVILGIWYLRHLIKTPLFHKS